MAIYQIIGRRMSESGSRDYRHIVAVQLQAEGSVETCTLKRMVTRLKRGDTAYVKVGQQHSEVGVFDINRRRYLRSFSEDYWTDHLVSLPTF
jgi:hypothetical protein